jgi:hypothetical protein
MKRFQRKPGPKKGRGRKRKPFGPRRKGKGKARGKRNGPGGERKRTEGPLNKAERQVLRKAQSIQKKSGIPFDDALEIAARGSNVSLRKLRPSSPKDRIDQLTTEYRLPRSVAGNVISGNLPLEKALLRTQIRQNLRRNRMRSCLVDAMESDEEIELQMVGGKSMTGRITDVQPYTFHFKRTPAGKRQTRTMEYLKLNAKYGYPTAFSSFVNERAEADSELRRQRLKPPEKVIDRRMIKNEKLQRYMNTGVPTVLKTYEGEVFRGRLSWWGQYEFGLDLGRGAEVTFFRHAVYLIYKP